LSYRGEEDIFEMDVCLNFSSSKRIDGYTFGVASYLTMGISTSTLLCPKSRESTFDSSMTKTDPFFVSSDFFVLTDFKSPFKFLPSSELFLKFSFITLIFSDFRLSLLSSESYLPKIFSPILKFYLKTGSSIAKDISML
jgi:hypothetical protein